MPAAREPGALATREHGTQNDTSIVFLHGGSVAGWMWEPQVTALQSEFHCLVPDLPGFGASNDRPWLSIADAAADVRELIATRGHGGRAHLVGLSLGAVVGLQVLAQDSNGQSRVPSAVLSGTTVVAAAYPARIAAYAQLHVWRRRWYWAAMARAYGIGAEDRAAFVDSGLAISVETMRRVVDEVMAGIDLVSVRSVRTPVLLASGSQDARSIREASLVALAEALPQATAVLAPGGHHHWNAEQPASSPRWSAPGCARWRWRRVSTRSRPRPRGRRVTASTAPLRGPSGGRNRFGRGGPGAVPSTRSTR